MYIIIAQWATRAECRTHEACIFKQYYNHVTKDRILELVKSRHMATYDGAPDEEANRLLKATVTSLDSHTDFNPSIKRCQYDLDDINEKINLEIKANAPALLECASTLNEAGNKMSVIEPDLENVRQECSRLHREFVSPYERLEKAFLAAQKLTNTANLVRNLCSYLGLSQQLANIDETNAPSVDIHSAAKLICQIEELLAECPSLRSMEVVRTHEKTLGQTRDKLIDTSLKTVRDFNGSMSNSLRYSLLTLSMLHSDKLFTTLDTYVKSQVGFAVSQLSLSIGTRAMFDAAWQQCMDKAKNLELMTTSLSEAFLLTRAEIKIGGPLVSVYWQGVAMNLDQKLHKKKLADVTAFRGMNNQKENILQVINDIEPVMSIFKKYLV